MDTIIVNKSDGMTEPREEWIHVFPYSIKAK